MNKSMLKRAAVGLLVAGLALSNPSMADGDAEAGRIKAYTCTGCHGIPGYVNADVGL